MTRVVPRITRQSGRPEPSPGVISVAATGDGFAVRSDARVNNPWLTLVTVSLGVVMVGLDTTVVAIANPFIARDLNASLSDLQWITNAYLLALSVLLIVGGKLGDHYGRRRIFMIGTAGFAISSALIGLSGSILDVIVLRAVQGAFGALLLPNTLALLRATFPAEKLNDAIGMWTSTSAIAIAGAPVVGGLLLEHGSWRTVFFLNIPISVVTLCLGLWGLVESRESVRHRMDTPGVALLAAGMFVAVFAIIGAETWTWQDPRTWTGLGLAVVLLTGFVAVEARVRHPLLPLRLFRDRSLTLGVVTVTLGFVALYAVLFFVSLYLQSVQGFSAVGAAVRTLPMTALFACGSPLAARLTTRFGPGLPVTLGMLLTSIGLIALLRLQAGSPYTRLWPSQAVLGLGFALVVVASAEAIVGNAPVDDSGVAAGLQSTAMQFGGVLGASVLGAVLASRVSSVLPAKLAATGLTGAAARAVLHGQDKIRQGLTPTLAPGSSPHVVRAAGTASHAAFISGLHEAMLVGAIVALIGAAGGPFIRAGAGAPAGHRHVL